VANLISEREFITQLELSCKDLQWYSEAEYPLRVLYWRDLDNFTPSYLLERHNYPEDTKIAIKELNTFFSSVTKQEPWHNQAEQLEVQRYRQLKDLLDEHLTELKVYLLGEVEIDVYILGKTLSQAIAGIETKIVRT